MPTATNTYMVEVKVQFDIHGICISEIMDLKLKLYIYTDIAEALAPSHSSTTSRCPLLSPLES